MLLKHVHAQPMGVYGGSTFHQGEPATPPAHPAPPSSACNPVSTIGNGFAVSATASGSSTPTGQPSVTGSPVRVTLAAPPSDTTVLQSSLSNQGSHVTASSSSSVSGTGSNANSGIPSSILGWERVIMAVGSAVVLSMLGALYVL